MDTVLGSAFNTSWPVKKEKKRKKNNTKIYLFQSFRTNYSTLVGYF